MLNLFSNFCIEGDMRLIGLAGATIALTVAWTGAAQAVSLQDAVEKAVASIPAIGSAQARRLSSEERVRVERGALFPVVNIRGETGAQYTNSPTTRGRSTRPEPDGDGDTTLWRNEGRLIINQLLYDGGTTFNVIDEAQNNLVAATFRVDDAKRSVALQAIAAYIDVQRNREFVAIAVDNIAAHERCQRQTTGPGGPRVPRRRFPGRCPPGAGAGQFRESQG
jgi:adhesin transport system outer membrane protein